MVGESRFGGITRSGFLGLMLVGGLVVGLFFIPELLQISSGSKSSQSSSASVSARNSVNQRASSVEDRAGNLAASDTAASNLSDSPASQSAPSAAISESRSSSSWGWWTELKAWFEGLTTPRLARVSQTRDDRRQTSDGLDARASLGSVSQRLDGARPGQPTWANIRSNESKEAVSQARRDSLELARGLPSAAIASKFAIIDFANGLEFVMTRAEQQMTPREAVIYLTRLDQNVSRLLAEDKVDRVFVKRWSQISVGPVLGKTMLGQRHESDLAPFDPQLTITAVQIVHKGMRKGDPNTGKVKATLSGYLIGDDIKSVVMEANNGGLILKLNLKRDRRGFWFFNRGSIDARQTWTFKVYDKFGERYQKVYQFFPKAKSFPYEQGKGYQVPFKMARAKVGVFRSQDFDPRLDEFFSLRGGLDGQDDPNASFVTF